VDRELAAALAGELPAAANIKVDDALPVSFTCPPGSRGAAYYLPAGQISVVILPGNEAMSFDSNPGTTNASASTSTGNQVIVVSDPITAGDPAPYASDLYRFARAIAGIY
jgi:hypothetical protein